MAERKTTSQSSSRAKGATGKTKSTGKSSAARSKKAAEAQRLREEEIRRSMQKRRVASVILFAVGILLTLMALIPGSMGWRALYDVMHGLFGVVPWAFGPLMISAALVISSQKTHATIQATILKRALFMLMLCAAVEIFGVGKINGANFGEVFVNLYVDGVNFAGGGIFALFLGIPLLFLGKLGAAIVIIILAIVCILLNIPIPLNEMFSGIGGSLKNAKSSVSERRELARERRSITDEHYREIEQRDRERKAQARQAKRAEKEDRRGFYVNNSKSDQMNDIREAVNSVGDVAVLNQKATKPAPQSAANFSANSDNELPEPLKMQPPKIKVPEMRDTKPLMEQQKSDARDYKEALKRYMEKKHPIMRDPDPADPNKYEDNDADIVPLIDALEKINAEKSPARVS
ncbi:MAG: hypothetical protein K2J77_04000, partial [Oscillospiraceae bacterium]|nr:hypothetical protein [Oscillospiraceae bacterium]